MSSEYQSDREDKRGSVKAIKRGNILVDLFISSLISDSDSAAVAGLALVSPELDWCPGVVGRHEVGVLPSGWVQRSGGLVQVARGALGLDFIL